MNSTSISQPPGEPSPPEQQNLQSSLSEQQRAFAKVVGQALAEAWRRQSGPASHPSALPR
jgi:hypothetical protein